MRASTLKGSAPKPRVRGGLSLLPVSGRPAIYLASDGELGREALGKAVLRAVLLPFPFSLIVIPKASLWKLQNNGSAICACVAMYVHPNYQSPCSLAQRQCSGI